MNIDYNVLRKLLPSPSESTEDAGEDADDEGPEDKVPIEDIEEEFGICNLTISPASSIVVNALETSALVKSIQLDTIFTWSASADTVSDNCVIW